MQDEENQAMARNPLSVRTFLVVIAVVAVCIAVLGIFAGGILAISVVVVILDPRGLCWRTLERGTTVAWFLGAVLLVSDVWIDGLAFFFFYIPLGLLLGFSWLLRQACEFEKPRIWYHWLEPMFMPGSFLLVLFLVNTDLGFHWRLALSEPSLRSEARRTPPGFKDHWWPGRQIGLFKTYSVEEREGCVLWTTGGGVDWFRSEGLAYIPNGRPPLWTDYTFRPVWGAWWRFVVVYD